MQKSIIAFIAAAVLALNGQVAAANLHEKNALNLRSHSAFSKRSSNTKKCDSDTKSTKKTTTENVSEKKSSNSSSHVSTTGGSIVGKVIADVSSSCGSPDAQAKPSTTDGPNGKLEWLNCGVDKSGWKPPKITLENMVYVDLDDAMKMKSNAFSACKPYVSLFKTIGDKYEIPPIILASLAMQESSCQPNTANGGLMQLTKDKCPGNKEGAACNVPSYNIDAGAKYFNKTLHDNEGNVPLTLGVYNGWVAGLTIHSATKIKSQCCQCQNNLDYLHQTMNGWFQGISPYATHMGKYFNVNC